MAELGDFVGQGATSRREVTVEMMEYDFVDKCESVEELRAILVTLRAAQGVKKGKGGEHK